MAAGFQCKQFFIGHQHCAMKVGTDAFLLGAWVSLPAAGAVLDIGCGSGILSLMLAQRSQGLLPITALDLDAGAVRQSQLNAAKSPWPEAIRVLEQDILTYQPQERYSLLVCNPPYFHQALPSTDAARQRARHSDSLPWQDLLQQAWALSSSAGVLALVLPADSLTMLLHHAGRCGWQLQRLCRVTTATGKTARRVLVEFGHSACTVQQAELSIRQGDGEYSAAYRALLQDFYLNF